MGKKETLHVLPALDGMRLDKVLAELFPDAGLRLRRRYCDDGNVEVDGRIRKPGYKVRAEQMVVVSLGDEKMSFDQLGLSIVRQSGLFAAIYKPSGVHSASIEGKESSSVEDALSHMFPDAQPQLLNRLDYLTSGLLLVSLGDEGEHIYREKESAGEVKKFYLAKVHGRLDGMVSIRSTLDIHDRKKTRVLAEKDPDSRRWTDVDVLSHDNLSETSMVRCLIMKGARHQIRAHLASLDHPIIGDPIYGVSDENDTLHLHHQRIEFPGFSAEIGIHWAQEG